MKKKSSNQQRKQTQRKKANSNNQVKGGPVNFAVTPTISPCSRNYIKCLANPFGAFNELPCIPDVISFPSYKFKTLTRGIFTAGSTGVGWVAMRPMVPFSDITVGQYTNASYAGTEYDPSLANVIDVFNDSPFTNAMTTTQYRRFRLVGAGIKVRYTGPELYRGGRIILARAPGGIGLTQPSNDSELLSLRTTNTAMVTRREECVTYYPDTLDDLDYRPLSVTFQSLLIYVSGGTAGNTFEYEMVQYWEAIGNTLPTMTVSHSDPVGLGAALSSLPKKVSNALPSVAENNLVQKTMSALMNSFSGLLPTVARGAIQVGANYLANRYSVPSSQLALMNSPGPVVTEED